MHIINNRHDLDNAPESIRAEYMDRLASSIYRKDADGNVLADTSGIERFGFALADFPDAQVMPYVATPEQPPQPRSVTKLTIMQRLDALGKWEVFKAILATLPPIAQDAWM